MDAGSYSSYLWSTNAATKSINVNAAGSYSVTVTDANGCSGSASATTSLFAAPVPVITGTLSFCASTATTLDAGSQYNNYLWTTGATSHSISVNTAGTFGVTVTDNNGCVGSASATTNSQGSLPQTPGPISGPVSTLCNTTGNVYTISPVPNTTLYVWTVPQGATITAGQGTTSITVSYSSTFTSGNIIVAASNACGQSPSLNPRTLLVQAIPSQPGNILGTTSQLCSTQQAYSIVAVQGATSYTWTVPSGATIVSGQNGLSILVSFPSSFVSGSICVKANSICGSSTTNCITVTGPPSTPGAISGIYSVCSRQKNVVYTVPLLPGATSYTWAVPSQATIVSGQGSNTISVTFGVKTGNITVKASNSCGSSALQTLAINMNCTGANARIATVAVALAAQPVRLVTKISVYPNPSTGRITLEFIRLPSLTYQVSVLDVLGQSVYSQVLNGQGNSVTLDLAHLRKGVYLLRLFNGYSYKEVTIVIQ